MKFNSHSEAEGRHAFLSASKYHWVNYDDDKLENSFRTAMAAREGTASHEFASLCIKRKQKLPETGQTLNLFVNDCIGFRMESEQILYYSENAFGTADAVKFADGKLSIFDLKNGVSPASMTQLEIYAAFFCLEYGIRPSEIEIELRIYQNDAVVVHEPELHTIVSIMDKIVYFDNIVRQLKEEAAS